MFGIVHGLHILPAGRGRGILICLPPGPGFSVIRPVTIRTGKRRHRSARSPQVLLEMYGVIEFYGAGINGVRPLQAEFGMSRVERIDDCGELELTRFNF